MKIPSTTFCTDGVVLPYKIKVDNPKASIGIFGDSFAQLAEFNQTLKNIPGSTF